MNLALFLRVSDLRERLDEPTVLRRWRRSFRKKRHVDAGAVLSVPCWFVDPPRGVVVDIGRPESVADRLAARLRAPRSYRTASAADARRQRCTAPSDVHLPFRRDPQNYGRTTQLVDLDRQRKSRPDVGLRN